MEDQLREGARQVHRVSEYLVARLAAATMANPPKSAAEIAALCDALHIVDGACQRAAHAWADSPETVGPLWS